MKNNNYWITVNEKETLVKKSEAYTLDSITVDDSNLHLLEGNKAYRIQVLHSDFSNKMLTLSINGNTYEIQIEDAYDQQVKKMGLLAVTAQKINSIKAPMPGLIVDVMVKEGQEIFEGTPLLVLSAMKMENIIVSQGEGVIKSIKVEKDAAVDKGQLVIEME